MNKKKIISFIIVFICVLSISIGSLFAWYTSSKTINEINGNSAGVNFSYLIDDKPVSSVDKYSIENLTFFDVESEKELSYFVDMSNRITITLKNLSSISVNYTVSQGDLELPIDFSSLTNIETAYVKCLFSLEEITIGEETKIIDLYGSYESATGSLNINESVIIYVYIIGVQMNPDADQSFLDETYNFKINLKTES